MYDKVCVTGLLAASLALAACNEHELAMVDPNRQTESYKDVPVDNNRDLDILFVIDNSQSMGEEQESLAANFSRFIEVLEGLDGGLPNVHLGVVSTDVGAGNYGIGGCVDQGDSGRLQSLPRAQCQPPAGAFIRDKALPGGERDRNYTGSLADAFSCIAKLGIEGCGFEQPLEAMKRALDESNPGNRLFLRENAFLLVVFITDEDDCSAITTDVFDPNAADTLGPITSFRCFEYGVECDEPMSRDPGTYSNCRPNESSEYIKSVQPYVDFLKSLKADPGMIMVAGIVGNASPVEVALDEEDRPELQPSCTSGSGVAAPAVRLNWFFDQFPERNTVTTICNDDLSGALELVAQQILPVLSPCIEGNIDIDPNTEGVQYECVVSDVRFPGEARQEETPLSECSDSPTVDEFPCWHLDHRPDTCPTTTTQMSLIVERDGATVPSGTHTIIRCRVIE